MTAKPVGAVAALLITNLAVARSALAQEDANAKIVLWIFDARVRTFAPGIDAIITLRDDQKQQLAAAYAEVFGTNAVALANMVLQDSRASMVQREQATAIVRQAQAAFRAKSREAFTDEQRQLIDSVYGAFERVYGAAEQAMVKRVKTDLASELDGMLSAEQKAAMERRKAEMAEAGREAPPDATGDNASETE